MPVNTPPPSPKSSTAGTSGQTAPENILDEAVALAKKADTVLLCLGLDEIKESEGIGHLGIVAQPAWVTGSALHAQ